MSQMFTSVTGLKRGYCHEEVNEYFEFARQVYQGETSEELSHRDIHTTVFDLKRGGYVTQEVDAAMDRLENAFVARNRQLYINEQGPEGWSAFLNEQAKTLYPRLTRKPGQRFRSPQRGHGYDKAEVDAMCTRLTAFFNGRDKVTAAQIRSITFSPARKNNAYEESSVDAFVARAVEVLLGVQ